MSRFSLLVAGLSAAAMGLAISAPAFADAPVGFAGTVSGSYTARDFGGDAHGSANLWALEGQAAFGLGMFGVQDLAAEIDGGYHNLSHHGAGGIDQMWNVGGHVFWAPGTQGRLGATVQYDSFSGHRHLTQYGGFAEYYANEMITLGVSGGGWTGKRGSFGSGDDGGYVGGGVTGYLMPDLALTAQVSYFSGSGTHLTNYTAQAEYLVTETLPVTVFGGYTYTDIPGPRNHLNQWLVGIKFYTNGNGTTLVDKQRKGALDNLVRPLLPIGE